MKTPIQQKVQEAVAELGLSSSRLVIPTRENVAQLDAMLEAMLALLETKRLVEKAEYDIQVLKKRLGLREQSTGKGIPETDGGDSMHVDYAHKGGDVVGETPGENERSQSVLSVRSARSRKHVSTMSALTTWSLIMSHVATTLAVGFLSGHCLNKSWHETTETKLRVIVQCLVCTTIHIECK